MKSTKRSPRTKPCKARGVDSKGTARMSKHPLTEVEKALLGKGMVRSFKPIGSVAH
jgi:hypothetical protein